MSHRSLSSRTLEVVHCPLCNAASQMSLHVDALGTRTLTTGEVHAVLKLVDWPTSCPSDLDLLLAGFQESGASLDQVYHPERGKHYHPSATYDPIEGSLAFLKRGLPLMGLDHLLR